MFLVSVAHVKWAYKSLLGVRLRSKQSAYFVKMKARADSASARGPSNSGKWSTRCEVWIFSARMSFLFKKSMTEVFMKYSQEIIVLKSARLSFIRLMCDLAYASSCLELESCFRVFPFWSGEFLLDIRGMTGVRGNSVATKFFLLDGLVRNFLCVLCGLFPFDRSSSAKPLFIAEPEPL